MLGSGTAIEVRGITSGTVASFTDAGSRPTQASGLNGLALGGDNIHVAGMNVQANATYGIQATGRSNVVLNQVGLSGLGSLTDGLQVSGSGSGMRILDTIIENTNDDGLQIIGNGHTITISGSTIDDVGYGIFLADNNNTLSMMESIVSNVASLGMNIAGVSNEIELTNTQFDQTTQTSIYLLGTDNIMSLTGVDISNTASNGITIDGSNSIVTMNDSAFEGSIGRYGFQVLDSGSSLNGSGNTATGATFGNGLCNTSAPWTGSIEFDGTTYTAADC